MKNVLYQHNAKNTPIANNVIIQRLALFFVVEKTIKCRIAACKKLLILQTSNFI